jgi:hypothetical protein
MKKVSVFILLALLCAIISPRLFVRAQEQDPSSPNPSARQEQDLAKLFRQHDRLKMNTAEVADQVRRTKQLSIYTSSAAFDLELEPHDLRAPNYRAVTVGADCVERTVEMGAVHTYKGKVLGRDDAQARFTIDDHTLEGLIITPEERYIIEPMRKYSAAADETDFVFYRSSDVIEDSSGTCAVTMDEEIDRAMEGVSPDALQSQAPSATTALREIEIATEADAEYVRLEGSDVNANNEILTVINNVDGVYQTELGLTFKVVLQHTWTDATKDPYSATDIGLQLGEFKSYWNAHYPPNGPYSASNPRRDVAHMWTGKQQGAGRAYSQINNINGVVCRALNVPGDLSYSIVGRFPFIPQEYILTAHEIGHNLSATHNDTAACAHTIMNTSADNSTQFTFCTASRDQITSYVSRYGTCLAAATACSFTLSPISKSFTYAGGSDRVSVTTGAGCQWTAHSNVSWITITAGASGTGSGAVSYTVASNPNATSRTGTMTIAGLTFTVTEAGRPSTFTISGKVTIGSTATGLSGVTVKLTGTRTATVTTTSTGSYQFTGLPTGNYRVTPTKLGYLFTPAYRAYTSLSANQTAANFSAVAHTFTITAKATLNGVGLAGVTMKLTGSRTLTCTTGATGSCQFLNLPAGGAYTVTPSKTGFTFTPTRKVYSYLTANQTAAFTATATVGFQGSPQAPVIDGGQLSARVEKVSSIASRERRRLNVRFSAVR